MTKPFLFTALALLITAAANAQVSPPMIAAVPVNCEAKGYWSVGPMKLILRKLNAAAQTADLDAVNSQGMTRSKAWFDAKGAQWSFKEGILEYNRPNAVRIHLTVGERSLKGSYTSYQAPLASRSEVVFNCDGPLEPIIVR